MNTKLYRVTVAAPARLFGRRAAEGDLLTLHEREARFEVDQGWIEETTVADEARPVEGITDAERAALPPLDPNGADVALTAPE